MANKYDDTDGVWRTIGGRRVFIRTGQSLSDAMKESGKFKKSDLKKNTQKYEKELEKEPNHQAEEAYREFTKEFEKKKEEARASFEKNEEKIKNMLGERDAKEEYIGDIPKSSYDIADEIEEKFGDKEVITRDEFEEFLTGKYDDEDADVRGILAQNGWETKFESDDEGNEGDLVRLKDNKELEELNKQAEEYAKTGLKDEESIKQSMQKVADQFEQDKKDGKVAERLKQIEDEERQRRLNDRAEELKKLNKQADEYATTGLKDGKYFRDRLLELDKEDTPTGTYDIETGEAVDFKGKGYSVSFEQTGVQLNDDEYLAKINECRGRCDGNVYFGKYGGTPEVSFHTDDINEAVKIMKENNQYSIYDIANDTEIVNDEYDASTNEIKDLSQTKTQGEQYEDYKRAKLGLQTNEQKSTNDTMNEKIRAKASKKSTFKDDLPKHTEIKTQGTSNRKEVSENIQAHILDYYDSPQDFIDQMDAMSYLPTKWKAGEELAKGGSYLIYNGDMSDFLNELKINPKGKTFSEDKAFDMYTSLVGRESAKLYDRLQKNAYNKYKQSHPLTKMTLEEFIKSRKGE